MPPHCDSLDGPVVTAAGQALTAADVDLVLPCVPAAGEDEIRDAFAFQVYTNHLYQALHTDPHGDHGHR